MGIQINGNQIEDASLDVMAKATPASLATFFLADGTNPLTGNVDCGTFKLTALGNPTAAQDAATKAYVDGRTPLTAKGDLLAHTGAAFTRLGVGLDGNVLIADSTQTSGLRWGPASGGGGGIGPGTGDYIPVFLTPTTIGDSTIQDVSGTVTFHSSSVTIGDPIYSGAWLLVKGTNGMSSIFEVQNLAHANPTMLRVADTRTLWLYPAEEAATVDALKIYYISTPGHGDGLVFNVAATGETTIENFLTSGGTGTLLKVKQNDQQYKFMEFYEGGTLVLDVQAYNNVNTPLISAHKGTLWVGVAAFAQTTYALRVSGVAPDLEVARFDNGLSYVLLMENDLDCMWFNGDSKWTYSTKFYGFGNATPQTKLDVDGDATFRDNVWVTTAADSVAPTTANAAQMYLDIIETYPVLEVQARTQFFNGANAASCAIAATSAARNTLNVLGSQYITGNFFATSRVQVCGSGNFYSVLDNPGLTTVVPFVVSVYMIGTTCYALWDYMYFENGLLTAVTDVPVP